MKGIREEEKKESMEFFNNPNFIHYIGALNPPRPGVRLCFTRLEYDYFPPGTKSNDELFLRLINWEDMVWGIISIPKEKKELMERVASEIGLRIADGTPYLFTNGKVKVFPLNNERAFTLENTSGHPVYRNNPNELAKIFKAENREIERIIAKSTN